MTQDLSQTAVEEVLKQFVDPETGRDVLTMEQVSNLQVEGDNLRCDFGLRTHSAPIWESTRNKFEQHLRDNLPALESLEVNHVVHDRPAPPVGEFGLTVKSVIAVGRGGGGGLLIPFGRFLFIFEKHTYFSLKPTWCGCVFISG